MSTGKQPKLLIIAVSVMLTYLVGAEALLPIRATADERSVIPDIIAINETGFLGAAKYFSGVAYQFQSATILQLGGLPADALQLLSPGIAALAFTVFFSIGLLIYRRETDHFWWAFLLPAVSVVVFPGFVSRTWESTHKAYTFVLVFLAVYLLYLGTRRGFDKRYTALVGIFLISVGFLNYIWGIVYAILVGGVGLLIKGDRWRTLSVAAASGVIAAILPGISGLRRYHRAYFNAVQEQVNKIVPGLLSSQSASPSDEQSIQNGSNGKTQSSTSSTERQGIDLPELGSGVEADSTVSQALGQINNWPAIELLGLSLSSWYLYSAGIGVVALVTAITGIICLYSLFSGRLDGIESVTFPVLALSAILAATFVAIGDVATFKRVIVLPGVFGVLCFTVLVAENRLPKIRIKSEHRRLLIGSLLVLLLLFAGLSTNRSTVDGGDAPLDVYVNDSEVSQIDWIAEHGNDDSCYFVRQRPVAHYYRQQTGGRIGQFEVNPQLVSTVYQSTTADTVAYGC
jgi:hypothetical protein